MEAQERRKRETTQKDASSENFDMKGVTENTSFHKFEQDPETAVLLFLLNSGSERFREIGRDLYDADGNVDSKSIETLIDQIRNEVLTEEELE